MWLFDDIEAEEYIKFSLPHRRVLIIRSQLDPNRCVWNMKKLRKLVLPTSWLGFHLLSQRSRLRVFQWSARNCTPDISPKGSWKKERAALLLIKRTSNIFARLQRNHWCSSEKNAPLRVSAQGSPKLRSMIGILRDQVLIHHEKVIIWTMFPAEQVFIGEANIDAKVFHTSLGFAERTLLLYEFITERDKCMVLVCLYPVNAAVLNLQ